MPNSNLYGSHNKVTAIKCNEFPHPSLTSLYALQEGFLWNGSLAPPYGSNDCLHALKTAPSELGVKNNLTQNKISWVK